MRTVSTAGNNCLPEAIKLHMIRFSYVHSKRLHCKSYKQVKACFCSYCTELLNSDVVLRPNKAHAFLSFSTTSLFNDSCSIFATVQVVVSHTWKPGLSWNRKGVLISRFQVHLYTSVIYGDRNSVQQAPRGGVSQIACLVGFQSTWCHVSWSHMVAVTL